MSVYPRKGSPYYAYDFQIKGRRFFGSTKATTRRDALAAEKQIKASEREKAKEGDRKRLTLDEAFGLYWLEVASLYEDKKQRKDTQRYIGQILAAIGKDKLVEDLTDADVNDFVQARLRAAANPDRPRRAGKGEIATNRALAVWRQMHRRATKSWKQKTQVIDWSDCLAKERQRTDWLEFDQVRTLLQNLPDYLQLAVEWSVAAGTRRTATFSIEWQNVFWERGYLIVKEKGKDEFKAWLSPQLIDILQRAKALGHPPSTRKRKYDNQKDAERFVFCSRNWKKLWESARTKAGVPNFRWHDLRHTFATWLRQEGTPLEVVQRALGHAQITTTMRYAHVADRELQEALHRVPSFSTQNENVVSITAKKSRA